MVDSEGIKMGEMLKRRYSTS